jgi:hypothetical protein
MLGSTGLALILDQRGRNPIPASDLPQQTIALTRAYASADIGAIFEFIDGSLLSASR